jgi:peptidyl-prolyl cis-trans isomerase C
MQRKTQTGRVLASVLAASLLTSACGGKDKPDAAPKAPETKHGLTIDQAKQPLVKIGESVITVGDFAEELAQKSPYLRARWSAPERRRQLLDEMVKFELLAREATRRGLDQDDEVVRTKKQVMIQQMMKTEFEDKVKLADITDQEIEAYYKAHPEEFNKPAQMRASHIALKDEAKAKKLLKQILEHQEDNKLFRDLAEQNSEDLETKARFGDLQFFSLPAQRIEGDPKVPDAVAEAAFKLEKIGEVSRQLIKTEQGFHIVKLTGKRKELARTLEHARRPIQHKLWREKREAAIEGFVNGLRDKAKVEEHLELLTQLKAAPVDPSAVPGAPTMPGHPSLPGHPGSKLAHPAHP